MNTIFVGFWEANWTSYFQTGISIRQILNNKSHAQKNKITESLFLRIGIKDKLHDSSDKYISDVASNHI